MKRVLLAGIIAGVFHAVLLSSGAGWFSRGVPFTPEKKPVLLRLAYVPSPVKPRVERQKISSKPKNKPLAVPEKHVPKKPQVEKAFLQPKPRRKTDIRPKPVPRPKIVHSKPKKVNPVQPPPPPQEPAKEVKAEKEPAQNETAPEEKGPISPQEEPVTAEVVEDALTDFPIPGEEEVSEKTAVTSALPGKAPAVRVARPLYRKNPPPGYPRLARRRGYQGTVILEVLVLRDGTPGKVQVFRSSGYRSLDKAAAKAVKKWSFAPGSENGNPVDMRVRIPVRFQLD